LFQIARGSGATLSECTFFLQKAHVTQRTSSKQDHFKASLWKNPDQAWFIRQSQRTQGDLRVQPWNARGLVDAEPTGYPARKGKDLVWLGFLPCNPSDVTII
jgi:hypothetical protein